MKSKIKGTQILQFHHQMMKSKMNFNSNSNKKAFALIEVLVIIIVVSFLIAAFIFIRELNKNNSVKAFISQIAAFDNAIEQFYDKYDALPGDIDYTVAFGLSETNTDGNNNGIIEDANGGISKASGEITNFWVHLSNSKFISQIFDGAENDNAKIGSTFPISKISVRKGITVYYYNGKNYYQVGVVEADKNGIVMSDNSLKVLESFNIDIKIDDGLPASGRVIVVGGKSVNGIYEDTNCVVNKEYNTTINTPSCQLRIEFGTTGSILSPI